MNERHITEEIAIAGQPTAGELESMHDLGFRTVINLRTDGEEGTVADEKKLVEEAGLYYSHIPVSPDTLDDVAVQRFTQAIDSDGSQPVLVHCKGGGRAGVMTLLYLAIEHGWSIAQALEESKNLGDIGPSETSPYRPFFESYLRRHSPAER